MPEPNTTFSHKSSRVRFNAEYFGFIVGFPDGEIVLAAPSAMSVLNPSTTREELAPHLLPDLDVRPGFHLSTPTLAWLELTRKCNLDCPHCYIHGGRPRQNEMAANRWHGIIDEMADMGVWAVAFTGGEPTLHPAFSDFVIHARERDLVVGIATHGMFLTDKLLDGLPRDQVIFSVSIDDLHVGRRGHDSPSELGKQAILRAQRHGFLTNIMTSTHRQNIDGLANLMDWARSHRVSVRSVPLSPIGRGKKSRELECTTSEVERAAHFWLRECEWEHEYHRQAGLCVGAIFNYGLSLAYMTRRCSSARYLGYVASDGTLFPCTMCASENLFPTHSVKDRPFAEVWRADWEIRKYSWDNFAETCNGCPINDPRYYCASRCPAMSYARNGHYFGCGASEFEKQSTIFRTALLERTQTGKSENIPAVPPHKTMEEARQ